MASTLKFVTLGKSKFVHVVRTKREDLAKGDKGSNCQQVRKYQVAGNVPKGNGLSPEAASVLEPCEACNTAQFIKDAMPAEAKRAAAKDQRDATLEKARRSTETKAQAKKKAAKVKAPKEPKPKKAPKATKSGPRSVGGGEREKAEALAAFAKEHEWTTDIADADPGLVLTAVRGAETITCFFVDGKYDTSRHATVQQGSWTGKLRGVHGCRKQMAAEGRDRPHPEPGKGRSGPRKKVDQDVDGVPADESPEDARRRVPFSIDDPEIEIIDAIKGKTIKWRNGVSNALEEAWLPAEVRPKRGKREAKRDVITITTHPKTERRMVTFLTVLAMVGEDGEAGEQYGPERTVYLDKIVRVVG